MGRIDLSQEAQDYEQLRNRLQAGGRNFWRPGKSPSGTDTVRFLPPIGNQSAWKVSFERHFNVGPANTAVNCPTSIGAGPCLICEEIARLKSLPDVAAQQKAQKMEGTMKWLVYLIDRSNQGAGVLVGELTSRQMTDVLFYIHNGWGDITDPQNGYDFIFMKAQPSYKISPQPTPSPLNPPGQVVVTEEMLAGQSEQNPNGLPPLITRIPLLGPDEMRAALQGLPPTGGRGQQPSLGTGEAFPQLGGSPTTAVVGAGFDPHKAALPPQMQESRPGCFGQKAAYPQLHGTSCPTCSVRVECEQSELANRRIPPSGEGQLVNPLNLSGSGRTQY